MSKYTSSRTEQKSNQWKFLHKQTKTDWITTHILLGSPHNMNYIYFTNKLQTGFHVKNDIFPLLLKAISLKSPLFNSHFVPDQMTQLIFLMYLKKNKAATKTKLVGCLTLFLGNWCISLVRWQWLPFLLNSKGVYQIFDEILLFPCSILDTNCSQI